MIYFGKIIKHITCKTIDSSFSGLRLSVEKVFAEKEVELFITFAPGQSVHLKGRVMWQDQYIVGVLIQGGEVNLWRKVINMALGDNHQSSIERISA